MGLPLHSTVRKANAILGRTGEAFSQDESFDQSVRDEAELDRIVHYVGIHAPRIGRVRRLAGESACPTFNSRRRPWARPTAAVAHRCDL